MPRHILGETQLKAATTAAKARLKEWYAAAEVYARARQSDVRSRLSEEENRPVTIALLSLVGSLVLFSLCMLVFIATLPSVRSIRTMPIDEATIAYTADGQELARFHIENRTWVGLDKIAPKVIDALIATEDNRFYRHRGIDLPRVLGAIAGTAQGDVQGGSTITMQLARNIFPQLKDDNIFVRKVKEWALALRIEDLYSKDEILEMYLNVVPFLYETAGVEAASLTYFDKSARDLTIDEAATLVGMLKGTAYYNPVRHPDRSLVRRNVVLQQMVKYGYLDRADYERLSSHPTQLHFHRMTRQDNAAPFFAEYIRQWLDDWAEKHGYNLYTDGLRVYTTIDSRLQTVAEEAVATVGERMQTVVDVEWGSASPFFASTTGPYQTHTQDAEPFSYFWETHPEYLDEVLVSTPQYQGLISKGVGSDVAIAQVRSDSVLVDSLKRAQQRLEAGFVAIDPHNGYVKAWVGGRDFQANEFDHVALSRRQPGSTFKPFVYAAALENGYAPYSQLSDASFTWRDPNTGQTWRPQNFGGASGAFLSLSQGLALSKNTITAKLITSIGPKAVVDIAHRMGIRSPLTPVPSLGLGTSEVSLLELTSAYTTLANLGVHHNPVMITKITDRHGKALATFASRPEKAIPAYTAYAVLNMMRGVVQYGTGVRIRTLFGARGDLAAKTGTTQNGADGWFMFVHPDLVVGSWMGFYSPKVTFRSAYWGQGAHSALHVVGDFYQKARGMGEDLLDPKATFAPAPNHRWVATRFAEVEDLNVRERRSTHLREILDRIHERKQRESAAR